MKKEELFSRRDREQKNWAEHSRQLGILDQFIGLFALLIFALGMLYLTNAIHNRWMLLMIIFIGILMNLCIILDIILRRYAKKKKEEKRKNRK